MTTLPVFSALDLYIVFGSHDREAAVRSAASVRFLGRRVYVAVMLMLVSPPAGCAAGTLARLVAVPVRTVRRWRSWWRKDFQRTVFWRSVRERFAPPVAAEGLPQSLLARFQRPTAPERLIQLLRFISPLSTDSVIK